LEERGCRQRSKAAREGNDTQDTNTRPRPSNAWFQTVGEKGKVASQRMR